MIEKRCKNCGNSYRIRKDNNGICYECAILSFHDKHRLTIEIVGTYEFTEKNIQEIKSYLLHGYRVDNFHDIEIIRTKKDIEINYGKVFKFLNTIYKEIYDNTD